MWCKREKYFSAYVFLLEEALGSNRKITKGRKGIFMRRKPKRNMKRIVLSIAWLGIVSTFVCDFIEVQRVYAQEEDSSVVVIVDRPEYKQGDTLRYEVCNNSSEDIFIIDGQHNLNFIELQERDKVWSRYGLTMLPENPPEPGEDPYKKILPGSKIVYERWLGWLYDIQGKQQIKFFEGNYRLIVEYKLKKEDTKFLQVKSNEFKISPEGFQKGE